MAYQTGVSANISDLVSAVFSFATANGWTETASWVAGAFSIRTLLKNGAYTTFAYTATDLQINTATGLSSGQPIVSQPGACPGNVIVKPIIGPHVGYHLFTDGKVVNVAVEVVTGAFTHFNFGEITKNGTWAGGAFVTGMGLYRTDDIVYMQLFGGFINFPFNTSNNIGLNVGNNYNQGVSHIRSDVSGPGRVATFNGSAGLVGTDFCWSTAWSSTDGRPLVDASPNAANGRAVIVAINIVQATSGSSGPFYQLGHIANAGVINIKNYNPKDIVNTDWMVFPIGQKNGPGGSYVNSGNYGIAYKK